MKDKIITLLVLVFALIGCNGEDEVVETSTEMVGEPVNIRLSGQFEMCEREPESVLCETYEVEEEVVEAVEAVEKTGGLFSVKLVSITEEEVAIINEPTIQDSSNIDQDSSNIGLEEELMKIEALFEKGLIDSDERSQMRKKTLGLN